MSDKPASTSRWAVARTADRARDAQEAGVAGWEGIPLAKVRHKCLKRLDSEKTMKGNERSFTASRAFHGVPAASTGGFANSASAVEGRDFGVADFGAQAFENDMEAAVFECSDLMEVVEAGQIGNIRIAAVVTRHAALWRRSGTPLVRRGRKFKLRHDRLRPPAALTCASAAIRGFGAELPSPSSIGRESLRP